jgi:putative sigma-54 modulation protein
MDIHFTARRFKAHQEVRDHALTAIKRLDHYYDGIVRSDIILSFERKPNSVKTAEINVHVDSKVLVAKEKSEDFILSIDMALEKIMRQLDKYKTKVRRKDKRTLRSLKETQP